MKFDHVALKSNNIKRSVKWYKDNLRNVEVIYEDETWAAIKAHGIMIAFVMPHQHPPHVCFSINDNNKNNFKDKKFKKHRDGTEFCYISDPDGNTIEFLIR